MLIQEDRDHIDEDAKEEQEELLQKQTKSDQMEQKLSVQNQSDNQVNHAQKQIQKILKENHLVNEDLKGIEINLNF